MGFARTKGRDMQTATFQSPALALSRPVRWIAAALQETVALRLLAPFASTAVRGPQPLPDMRQPCLFVAHHPSHAHSPCLFLPPPARTPLRAATHRAPAT